MSWCKAIIKCQKDVLKQMRPAEVAINLRVIPGVRHLVKDSGTCPRNLMKGEM